MAVLKSKPPFSFSKMDYGGRDKVALFLGYGGILGGIAMSNRHNYNTIFGIPLKKTIPHRPHSDPKNLNGGTVMEITIQING